MPVNQHRWLGSPPGGTVLLSLIAFLIFWLFYPSQFLVADEITYFEQALAYASGENHLLNCAPCTGTCQPYLPGDYPAGTSLLASVFILLGEKEAVFWTGFFCWMSGTWALAYLLAKHGKPQFWAWYPWLFLPALVLCRTVMSDMPSFMLAAVFILLLTGFPKNRLAIFGAGLIGGLSLLFRETNLLWALPFALGFSLRKKPFYLSLWAGFFVGITFRFLTSCFLFGDPFYLRDSGITFSWHVFPQNLLFYGLLLTVVLPGGLWFWWKSTHPYRTEIGLSILLFVLVFSAYDYDAISKSGYKALFLQGRYMLPLLPFVSFAGADSPAPKWLGKSRIFGFAALGLFSIVQMLSWVYNREQQRLTTALISLPSSVHISFSMDESKKYLNRLKGNPVILDGNLITPELLSCQSVWYAHWISREESADRRLKAQAAKIAFNCVFAGWKIELQHDLKIPDGTRLQSWKAQRKKKNE